VGGYLVEYLSFAGDRPWQDHIESGDTVAGYHHQQILANGIDIPNLATVEPGSIGYVELHNACKGTVFRNGGKRQLFIQKPA
jgi:hypothetical protein